MTSAATAPTPPASDWETTAGGGGGVGGGGKAAAAPAPPALAGGAPPALAPPVAAGGAIGGGGGGAAAAPAPPVWGKWSASGAGTTGSDSVCHRQERRGQGRLQRASSLVRGLDVGQILVETMGGNVTVNQSNHERRMGMVP